MGFHARFLLACILFFAVSQAASLNDYLDEKLKQTKVEIAKIHVEESEPVKVKSYKVHWAKLWIEDIGKSRAQLVNTFNRISVLQDGKIMIPSDHEIPTSNASTLQEIAIWQGRLVQFVRSIVWKTTLYLLVCHETGQCSLYTGTMDSDLKYRQTIRHRGFPMDANFFTRANRLYLVVADNIGQLSIPSVIYHWTSTYMDVVAEIMTTDAVSVTTFNHKQSTIIVFAQNDNAKSRIGSEVYEFTESGVERIQFLPTVKPVSVQHYNQTNLNFVLLINEAEPAVVFWWDGKELLNWLEVPEIKTASLVRIVHVQDDSFFFVAHDNILQVYSVDRSNCKLIDSMELENNETVIDMNAFTTKSSIILLLITLKSDRSYYKHQWEVHIKESSHESSLEENNAPMKCLSELIELLQARTPDLVKAEASWPLLLPSTENLTLSQPINLKSLILETGTVESVDLLVANTSAPMKLHETYEELAREIDDTLAASRKALQGKANNTLTDVIVDGDAVFEELNIDSMHVDFLNGVDIRQMDTSHDEKIEASLEGRSIVVHDLELDSLCGIPSEYWMTKNDTHKIVLDIQKDNIEIGNDTIFIHSDVSIESFRTRTLNDIVVNDFLKDLFINGQNQVITGKIVYTDLLEVGNLMVEVLNDMPSENFMTKTTEQNLGNFSVKTMNIDHLYAESINGVPVEEAARISSKNVIKGQVRLANLHVTEELALNINSTPSEIQSVQIYDNVTIFGDVSVKNIDFGRNTTFHLDNLELRLHDVFKSLWTRSTNQTIRNKIALKNGMTIDRLDTKYLNGFAKDEFFYTTMNEIPASFTNLHFEEFHVNDSFLFEEGNKDFYTIDDMTLTVRGKLQLSNLRVKKLFASTFNGVAIDRILREQPLNISENVHFPSVQTRQVLADQLNVQILNDRNVSSYLKDALYVNESFEIDFAKTPEFRADVFTVEKINGFETSILTKLKNLISSEDSSLNHVTIDGDLIVENDLQINLIDNAFPDVYLDQMAEKDIVISTEDVIENLTVQNATLNFLYGFDVDNFFNNTFSRSRKQTIPGQFSFYKIVASNITAQSINGQNISTLIWIDEPLVFAGNVTFTNLIVEDDVVTRNLNGREVEKLYNDLLTIPSKNIIELTVKGNISWQDGTTSNLLGSFLENAVIRDTNQTIYGDTIFKHDVSILSLRGDVKEIEEIRDIISDTVINDGKIVTIFGSKVFKENISTNILLATNDIGIKNINDVDILEFNTSMIRKSQKKTITHPVIFLNEITIDKLSTNGSVQSLLMNDTVLSTDILPNNTVFEHLVVLENMYLQTIDRVAFDDFVNNRISLSGYQDISSDVQFNGLVEVTENADITKINGISTSELVLNGTEEPQVIFGMKLFEKDLIVDGNVNASLINDVDIIEKYTEGIQNDEDVDIFGDLIFETEVEIQNDTTVSGLVNEADINNVIDQFEKDRNRALWTVRGTETQIEEKIHRSIHMTENLHNIFLYLETEEKLELHVPNIDKANAVYYEKATQLNMYGSELGSACGLPPNCSCPFQYVAEFSAEGQRVWKTNDSIIMRNVHEPNGIFGINILTNTISSSLACTSEEIETEFTTISWMRHAIANSGQLVGNIQNPSLRIKGFLKDAKVFTYNDKVYVIFGIYYDASRKTHRTNSLVYNLNLETEELTLHQVIPTNGAWSLEIFRTDYRHGTHLLIGCFAESTKSLLYRFNPVTSKFMLLRTFESRSRYVKSVSQDRRYFILLDNPDVNAIDVFNYISKHDNFYDYQTLFHESRVNGIECFYADEFGNSDAFVIVTTEEGQFYIYEYMFAGKFQIKIKHRMDGVQTMLPFSFMDRRYIFIGRSTNSTVLRVVQQGPH